MTSRTRPPPAPTAPVGAVGVVYGDVSWDEYDLQDLEPCKSEPGGEAFTQPHQTRRGRRGRFTKVPWAKRRRRSKLAKQHRKILKQIAAQKAKDARCRPTKR